VFRRRARAFPDVAVALAGFRAAGTSVGVLTDVPYGMPLRLVLQDLSVAGLGSLAPSMLTSTEIGVRKPDPAGFEALADRQRCAAAAMLYVGNELKDVVGAKAAGMTAALISRSDSPIPAWGQDLTVTSLEQLLPVVIEGDNTGV
jgi:FMN phosphatase YigB (HAD superfamily)